MSCDVVRDLWPGAGLSDFDVTFEYEQQSDVRVALWNSTTKEYDDKTEYTPGQVDGTYWKWMNATEIRFVDQDDTPVTIDTPAADPILGYTPNGVLIYRDTAINPLPATFYPGSSIRAQDLNDNFDVLKMAIEESKCDADTILDTVDKQYWNKLGDTIRSTDTYTPSDTQITTTLAIENRYQRVMHIGDTPPTDPVTGLIWFNTDCAESLGIYVYDGTFWVNASTPGKDGVSGGTAIVAESADVATVEVGALWYNSDTSKMFCCVKNNAGTKVWAQV